MNLQRTFQIVLGTILCLFLVGCGSFAKAETNYGLLPYQATYECRVGNQVKTEREISDGKRFVRRDYYSGSMPKTALYDFAKLESTYWDHAEFSQSTVTRDVLKSLTRMFDVPKIDFCDLGSKQIDQWYCHGYRTLHPYGVSEFWRDERSGILVKSSNGGFPLRLLSLSTTAPDPSQFRVPPGLKPGNWPVPPQSKPLPKGAAPIGIDKNLLPLPGRQADGSEISIDCSQTRTMVLTVKTNGSKIRQYYAKDSYCETRVDPVGRTTYCWSDSAHSRCLAINPPTGPMILDWESNDWRRIRTTRRDGSFEEKIFSSCSNDTLTQDSEGRRILKQIFSDGRITTRSLDDEKNVDEVNSPSANISLNLLAGFIHVLRIQQKNGTVATSIILGPQDSFVVISNLDEMIRTESRFANDKVSVLETGSDNSVHLTCRPARTEVLPLESAPPFPREGKYFGKVRTLTESPVVPAIDVNDRGTIIKTCNGAAPGSQVVRMTIKGEGEFALTLVGRHLVSTESRFTSAGHSIKLSKNADGSVGMFRD